MNWQALNKPLNILLALLVLAYIVHYFYKKPKYESGTMAKDFQAVLQSGKPFELSSLRGKYVLLDFWGSWCGPCRRENTELVPFYHQIKNKKFVDSGGFEIISIGLESKKEHWEKAIVSDGLVWEFQIGEFERLSGPLATLYGIREIPTKYLINPEGRIIMVNPKISEISAYMEEKVEH